MTDLTTEDLQALVGEATPGEWKADRADGLSVYMRHEDGVKGRHIADTGRISAQAPAHIKRQDQANARLIAQAPSLAQEVIALRERVKVLERTLREIGNFRKEAHEYDEDVGHDSRDFDGECWDCIELLASQALKGEQP